MLAVIVCNAIFTGCSSKSIRGDMQFDRRLFPLGLYWHEVNLNITPKTSGATPQHFSFSGVIRLREDTVDIAVLSPFNTTLLKMHEDLKQDLLTTQVFVDDLKKHESKFKEYYRVLKGLLFANREADGKGPEQLTLSTPNSQIVIYHFTHYDDHNIPDLISVTHPNFNIEVKVSGYEL